MIPRAYITEWARHVPWKTNEQVEQDLIICRALVAIFSEPFLSSRLAFRGGTALNKLYLVPQPRYSEDIDLVQVDAEPFGPVIDRLREVLSFLGDPQRQLKERNSTMVFRFESEFPPIRTLKLKIETNCREHFSCFGLIKIPFEVKSPWFEGSCEILTYQLEELLGTKLRALYQRKKGRDLFDLQRALVMQPELDIPRIITAWRTYMSHVVDHVPSAKQVIDNLDEKMQTDEFLGDIVGLIRSEEQVDMHAAAAHIKEVLIKRIDHAH